jgi:hypothetical protein
VEKSRSAAGVLLKQVRSNWRVRINPRKQRLIQMMWWIQLSFFQIICRLQQDIRVMWHKTDLFS